MYKDRNEVIKSSKLAAGSDGSALYPICPICGDRMTVGILGGTTHFMCFNKACGADISFRDPYNTPIDVSTEGFVEMTKKGKENVKS